MSSQGKNAFANGASLEKRLANGLNCNFYEIKDKENLLKQLLNNKPSGKRFTHQPYVGETWHATRRKPDFLVFDPIIYPDGIIFECKHQIVPGTADEKLPHLAWNSEKTREDFGIETILILGGGSDLAIRESIILKLKEKEMFKEILSIEDAYLYLNVVGITDKL